MRFLYTSLFFAWAAVVLVPLILYLFRPRPRTIRTSTLPFFKWLAREHQENAWLRRLKHLLSLLLSILVILAAAAALGRLVVAPSAQSLKTVVILLDRSASMDAQDEEGVTRLEAARTQLQNRLAGLSAGVGVVVIAYDRAPEVVLSRSLDRRQVDRALEQVRVRPIEGDASEAKRLARQLAQLDTPAAIWHVTDGLEEADLIPDENAGVEVEAATTETKESDEQQTTTEPQVDEAKEDIQVEHLSVALTNPLNVGITAFQLRRLPLERSRFDAFVQVHAVGQEAVEANLDIEIDGKLVDLRRITLEPGTREKLLIPVESQANVEKILTLKLTADGDALALDNTIHARVPPLQPVRVLWISESPDPFTELALSTLGVEQDLELLHGKPSAWPPKEQQADVVIFDSWLPSEWPEDIPVLVVNPPGPLGPVRAARVERGLRIDSLRAPAAGHPVLYGVATDRVAVTQTVVLDAEGPLESLWVGTQGPLLLAGELRDQRIVVLGFSPQLSEQLPLMASYPLLLGNAIYWAAENAIDLSLGMNHRTGEFVELAGKTLVWESSEKEEEKKVERLEGQSHELDRIGLWNTEEGEKGSAALLSTYETSIPSQEEDATSADSGVRASIFRGDMVPILLWLMLLILIVESWAYHRSLTY